MATQTPELPASPLPGAAPSGADPVGQTLAMLQPWIDYVPKHQRRLGLFIFFALLVHLATFFFIRIDTTRAELRHQMRTRVTVENPQAISREGPSVDNFWSDLTDPRLFLLPIMPLTRLSSDEQALDFTSINSSIGPRQLPAPAQAGDYEFVHQVLTPLEQRAAAALVPSRQPFFYDESPRPIATNTVWQWDAPLARRSPVGAPDLPSPVSDTDLLPTQLRVAIDADGAVRYVLIEQSCGKLDMDQQAALAARKIRFRPEAQSGLLWGLIMIFWHDAAQLREEVVPTPPSGI